MAAVVALDASALIALLDAGDTHHDWAVGMFVDHAEAEFSVSALTFAECLVHPTQAGRVAAVLSALRPLQLDVEELTELDAVSLAQVRASSGLRMPDAVVLQLALKRGAWLATTDSGLARAARTAGVTVVVPA